MDPATDYKAPVSIERSDPRGSLATPPSPLSFGIDFVAAHDYPLNVSVRSARTLGMTIVVAVTITWIVTIFSYTDADLTSFNSNDKDDQRKDLLDYYNSISGGIANAVSKIVEMILQGVVAVGMLSFATKFTLYDYKFWYGSYTSVLVAAALGYLISSGLSALNVQVVPASVMIQMNSQDLVLPAVTNTSVAVDGVLESAWNKSFSEMTDGNPVLNTVFRSFIQPFDASSDGICTQSDYGYSHASVSFGYPSRSWHSMAALDITDTEEVVQFNLNTELDSLDDGKLSMKENIAMDLLIDILRLSWSWNRPPINMSDTEYYRGSETLEWKFNQNASASNFSIGELINLTKNTRGEDNFLQASTRLFRSALQFEEEETSSTTIDYSNVKYSHLQISDTVVFDSITLELAFPVNWSGFSVAYQCTRNGCWNRKEVDFEGFNQHVRAYGQCLNKDGTEETRFYREDDSQFTNNSCVSMSNSSMRIFSGGRRCAGGTWTFNPPEDSPYSTVDITNVRQILSVTMGRLSWQLRDLSSLYGHNVLLKRVKNLKYGPIAASWNGNFWTYLVQVIDPTNYTVDAVLPRMFDHLSVETEKMKLLSGDQCNKESEFAIDRALKNHLYIEDSYQAACIGAFHFLFQNAVEHQPLDLPNGVKEITSQNGNSSLKPRQFSGNSYQMAVRASIPFVSMMLSLGGCAILLAIGVISVCYRSRSTDRIQNLADARTVAEAMINGSKFPPWLLRLTLEQQQVSMPLDHLQIKTVELTQENDRINDPTTIAEAGVV